jgi:signal transduction histidine kinase
MPQTSASPLPRANPMPDIVEPDIVELHPTASSLPVTRFSLHGQASLRLRLLLAWLGFVLFVLTCAAIAVRILFALSIQDSTVADLSIDMRRLATGLELQANGTIKLAEVPADPKFVVANSGKYWQVNQAGKPLFRSPSLWGHTLDIPRSVAAHPAKRNKPAEVRLIGPDDQTLFGIASTVTIGDGPVPTSFQIVSAVDDTQLVTAISKFTTDLVIGFIILATLLCAAAVALVAIGLRPLTTLRDRLSGVRNGDSRRITGTFPSEVMPLVAETNALLDAQDHAIDVARTRASNLAHGLKTPLAVMATHSRRLRRHGDTELAGDIDKQLEMMRRHVERELARTRERSTGSARYRRIDAATVVADVANALQQLPKSETIDWHIVVAPGVVLAVERADFVDIMGNLLDNAQKWASHQIKVTGRTVDGTAIFTIDDDGTGVPDDQLERVLQRGARADTSVPGTGLGLAIVNDLVHLYSGRLDLARSRLGGLQATVALPMK